MLPAPYGLKAATSPRRSPRSSLERSASMANVPSTVVSVIGRHQLTSNSQTVSLSVPTEASVLPQGFRTIRYLRSFR